MRRVLILGADGFIGRHLAFGMRADGWQVIACARRTVRLERMGFATLRADLSDPETHDPTFWAGHIGAGPVAVINAAGLLTGSEAQMQAVHVSAPRALYQALPAHCSGVLISAVGIVGNVEGLGLEALGVKIDRTHVVTDEYCRTGVEGLYAIGDIAGAPWLAHKASHEGVMVAELIAGKHPHPVKPESIAGCTYCQPQVASVGYTEAKAKELGYDVQMSSLRGIVAPAGLDEATTEQLLRALSAVNENPDFQEMMAEQGNPIAFMVGDEFAATSAKQDGIATQIWAETPWK